MTSTDKTTMRNLARSAFAILVLFMSLLVTRPAEAQPTCAERWPRDGLNLAGRLNDEDIRAYLDLGYVRLSDSGDGVWRLRFVTGERLEGTREYPAGTSVAVDGVTERMVRSINPR